MGTPDLSNLEWSAVAVALQDAHRCGCVAASAPGRGGIVERLALKLFGRRRPNGLADPKLETVRRFVCATNRRRGRAEEYVPGLAQHGFSPSQIDALTLLSV